MTSYPQVLAAAAKLLTGIAALAKCIEEGEGPEGLVCYPDGLVGEENVVCVRREQNRLVADGCLFSIVYRDLELYVPLDDAAHPLVWDSPDDGTIPVFDDRGCLHPEFEDVVSRYYQFLDACDKND